MNTPQGWKRVKLGDLAEQIIERIDNPKKTNITNYIGLEHLDSEQIRIKSYGSPDDVSSSKFLCKKGDIIFGRRRAYLKKLAVSEKDALVSTDAIILRPKSGVSKNYLLSILQSEKFWFKAISLSAGSLSPRVKWKHLAEEEFLLPPEKEQKKIEELLWAIEDNIEKTENLISINEKLKKGLLNELLTKGIGHKKFKKTEIGEIPEEWELLPLISIIEIVGGGTPKTTVSEYWGGTIPWVSVEDLSENMMCIETTKKCITEKGLKNSSTKILEKDSLIISARGTVGLIGKLNKPMAFNQSCYGINSNNKVITNYVYYLLKALVHKIKHSSYGSTFKSITRKNFELFKIALPPKKEQIRIANVLDEEYAFFYKMNSHINLLHSLKKKITDDSLSGNLRID